MNTTYFVKPNGVVINCKTQHTKYLYELAKNTEKYKNFWSLNKDKHTYIKDAFAFELGWIGVSFWDDKSAKIDDCIKPTKYQLSSIFELIMKHKCGYSDYIRFLDKFFN